MQYHFRSRSVLLQRSLSGAGYNNTFPYSWGGSSDIDLMADETGFWAVYTSIPNAGNILVLLLECLECFMLRFLGQFLEKAWCGCAGQMFFCHVCVVVAVLNDNCPSLVSWKNDYLVISSQ